MLLFSCVKYTISGHFVPVDEDGSHREERLAGREVRMAAAGERLEEDRRALETARREAQAELAAARQALLPRLSWPVWSWGSSGFSPSAFQAPSSA